MEPVQVIDGRPVNDSFVANDCRCSPSGSAYVPRLWSRACVSRRTSRPASDSRSGTGPRLRALPNADHRGRLNHAARTPAGSGIKLAPDNPIVLDEAAPTANGFRTTRGSTEPNGSERPHGPKRPLLLGAPSDTGADLLTAMSTLNRNACNQRRRMRPMQCMQQRKKPYRKPSRTPGVPRGGRQGHNKRWA